MLSGTALVDGIDIREDMDSVYARMGVCPQHDQLWDQLTAEEHLLFYGRLKNLKVELSCMCKMRYHAASQRCPPVRSCR
jgi:ABC-type multidrug transport system ATPase subunit